jgi:hypothetical protein
LLNYEGISYTHYYAVHAWDTPEWQKAWFQLLEDTPLILEASDVLITGPLGDDPDLTPPVVDKTKGVFFNGVANDSHEPLCFSEEDSSGFVKTLQKPYDLAVACFLLRAYLLAPENVELSYVAIFNRRCRLCRLTQMQFGWALGQCLVG